MHYRTLGRTGLRISEIGYGAWGIGNSGWQGASDEESARALNRAIDLGLTFIDTALGYGDGHSERLIGKLLRERSETIYVSTKIPPKNRIWPARPGTPAEDGFPADHVIACTETSLRNLGVDTIDVQQFHVWSDEWVGRGDWLEAVERLKRDGKIRFFGVSINDYEPHNALKLIESGVVDSVQVIYNVFEQAPEEQLFPACEQHKVGVIVRVALDEGGLTGQIRADTVFPEGDFRQNYFRGDRKREVERSARKKSSRTWRLPQMRSPKRRFASSSATRRCRPSSPACARSATSSATAPSATDAALPPNSARSCARTAGHGTSIGIDPPKKKAEAVAPASFIPWEVRLSSSPCRPACSCRSRASCRAAWRRLPRSGGRR
ncbi:aldo/keto reductase [Sinorhizobium fredii]|uniref:aldo/keto reductase n=1 Tax=Rhizobium fredii TaxID=380 RepID=UPI003512E027